MKAKTIKNIFVASDEAEDPWFESRAEYCLFRQKFIIFFFSPPSTTTEVRIIILFPYILIFNCVKLFYVSFNFYFCASERFSLSKVILCTYYPESRKLITFLA